MQGRRGRDSLFDSDSFAGFSALDGIGGHQNVLSSFDGGRDPFDDPFFTQPIGSMFESSFFGPRGSPLDGGSRAGFTKKQEPQPNKRREPVIEELNSDEESLDNEGSSTTKGNCKKHSRVNNEPYVEMPDDEGDGGRNNRVNKAQPCAQFYTFQSSIVSCGGQDGAYYTKSVASRAGSDGVAFEEFKEADSSTGQAKHRVSRGLHNKGHTLSRKLCSDGKVDATQILHNLNEGELDGFEQAWEGSSGRHLTGPRQSLGEGNYGSGSSLQAIRGALPSTQDPVNPADHNSHTARGSSEAHMQWAGRKVSAPGFTG